MNSGELVTIIIPTYNRLNNIATAIESVLAQTYRNIEIIVIDDGSTDGTEDFIRRQYRQVHYEMIEHAGQSAARNKGLSMARGNIIASLDSDDQWNPDFLELCTRKLETDRLDFVFTNWIQEFPDGRRKDFLSGDLFLKPYLRRKTVQNWRTLNAADLRKLYLHACPSPSSSAVIRKSSIVSGWNEKVTISDDWCMMLDMVLAKSCRAAFNMDVHWNKYLNSNNVYDGRKRTDLLELFHIQDTLEFMNRFKEKLSKTEFKVLTKRCVRGFVELAKHNAIKEFDIPQSARLMRDSIRISVLDTIIAIPDVIFFGVNRHLKMMFKNLKSSDE
jgi:glycosyltransferase involved in cell wall biosynthesis